LPKTATHEEWRYINTCEMRAVMTQARTDTADNYRAAQTHPGIGKPRQLNKTELKVIREIEHGANARLIDPIKKTDCAMYNACLSQAISGRWEGFSCASCPSYAMSSRFQLELEHLALRAMDEASRIVEQHGNLLRVRGVRPGADARRTIKPRPESVNTCAAD
jgi:hypothetical protein